MSQDVKLLAVDTSCDESCAAVFDVAEWRLMSDAVHSHVDAMARYGGVVPEIASREHVRGLPLAVQEACEKAGVALKDIDWFVVTNRPGLIGALLVGVAYVKALAFALGKPFSVLNHIEAHLFSPLITARDETQKAPPPFPWIALVVSGGHTELFHVKGAQDWKWLGGTLDDAAGEAFDKVGKLLKMPYPAGPLIDRWVREKATDEHRKRHAFPRAKVEGLQFSYSGLKTAVALHLQSVGELDDERKLAVCASAQEAILDPLVDKVRLAMKQYDCRNAVVTGGVACNSRLRAKLPEAYFPAPRHCTDNAAMVAVLGALHSQEGLLQPAPWNVSAQAHMD